MWQCLEEEELTEGENMLDLGMLQSGVLGSNRKERPTEAGQGHPC